MTFFYHAFCYAGGIEKTAMLYLNSVLSNQKQHSLKFSNSSSMATIETKLFVVRCSARRYGSSCFPPFFVLPIHPTHTDSRHINQPLQHYNNLPMVISPFLLLHRKGWDLGVKNKFQACLFTALSS